MSTPNDSRHAAAADTLAGAPRFRLPTPAAGFPARRTAEHTTEFAVMRHDRGVALRLALATVAIAAFGAGAIEYAGWQVVARLGDATGPSGIAAVPALAWLTGTGNNLMGALGVGLGGAAIGGLLAQLGDGRLSRRWRTIATGFALGTAGFLGFLAFLTSLAP